MSEVICCDCCFEEECNRDVDNCKFDFFWENDEE